MLDRIRCGLLPVLVIRIPPRSWVFLAVYRASLVEGAARRNGALAELTLVVKDRPDPHRDRVALRSTHLPTPEVNY